ncbi:class III lanthionine synthetase LanKC [Kitasatospora sp. NPDC056731]|uniref:class III lanthionine synthetase LanKC n=1 Tax=Kitasatospora sp. NPDC056731 TaxID=3155422 RepID=UPI003428795D
MSQHYDVYCMADPTFFDSPTELKEEGLDFALSDRAVPEGWNRIRNGDWVIYRPEGGRPLPGQGWKIHTSGRAENADRILDEVWDHCLTERIAFKHLSGRHILHTRNMKYAHRGSSGKLVTIYPRDEAQLKAVLEALDLRIGGETGPYILSDLRWNTGPLYVRYGGFTERHMVSDQGLLVQAIETPDGTLVPDRRDPAFHVPPWVTLPDFLAPQLRARQQESVEGLPYRIQKVLHFSNGGGLYVGEDERTGQQIVLKEARAHAGLTSDGADAVARLQRERDVLERLAGLSVVPRAIDYFVVGDHHFLVEEFLDGQPLNKFFGQRYPYNKSRPDEAEIAEYTDWALGICRAIEEAVDALHGRGVVFGDLHPFNVMVRPDGRVALIDYEVAAGVEAESKPALGNPAYAAPRDRTGFDIDRYALGCIRLAMFLPLTALLRQDIGKARHLAEEIAARFPVPPDFLDAAVRDILGPARTDATGAGSGAGSRSGSGSGSSSGPAAAPLPTPRQADWAGTRDSLASAILASATPDRDDRLFPGDIEQFKTGGLNLAHGAAGVLYALDVTGAGRFPEHEQWLLDRALRRDQRARLGFYDGLHGVAHVLDRLGHRTEALKVVELCLAEAWESLGADLLSGLSGLALNFAHLADATGESSLRDAAFRAADLVSGQLGGADDVPVTSGGRHPHAGLMRGSAGPALMFVRLYEQTRDEAFLDLAATALRQDLRRCLVRGDGALHVNEGWRSMPYLATGSAGLAMVLELYLAHREDEQFRTATAGVRISSQSEHYVLSGLFNGRAGILQHLASTSRHPRPADDPDVAVQIKALSWHALSYQGHLAYPGEQLLRLSMDLATGSAGVLLALGSALGEGPVHLPFLGRTGSA